MTLHLVPRVLQYFEQVAQFGSIQAASRELGISASAIHRQITAVEDSLGELLFERGTKGMLLTPAGHLLLELARDWRLDNARLWSEIQADRGVEKGEVRIGAMDGMVNGFVPDLVKSVARQFPRLHLSVEITSPDLALKGVLNGDIDVAAVVNVAPHENLYFHWSREFRLGCIMSPTHPLVHHDTVMLSDCIMHPIVFQSAALSIRKLLEARHGWIFERANHPVVVNSIQLMKLMVGSGGYVAITSELDAGPELRNGQLRFVPLGDDDLFRQRFAIISNVMIPETRVAAKVIETAVEIIERHSKPA